jgi:chaperonin GroEL (HSP60 family)
VLVTNDGATILKHLHILHPAAERLVRAARQQELIVGDGTTSVVIFSGTLAARTLRLIASNSTMSQNIIPSLTSAFQRATCSALEFLHRIAVPFENSVLFSFYSLPPSLGFVCVCVRVCSSFLLS